jgi:hypothetical protein
VLPRMRDPSPRGRGDPLERRWKSPSERTGEITGHVGEYGKWEGTPNAVAAAGEAELD